MNLHTHTHVYWPAASILGSARYCQRAPSKRAHRVCGAVQRAGRVRVPARRRYQIRSQEPRWALQTRPLAGIFSLYTTRVDSMYSLRRPLGSRRRLSPPSI